MDIGNLRVLSEAEIRKIWPREEQDLSRWIRDHADEINMATGLLVEFDEAEGKVGRFRLDLAGTDQISRNPVVVENQFGLSDHDHLGKLLTYSADREAGVIIWIANEFQQPHRKALEWLNSITGDELTFYGLRLEVLQIDDSRPAPRFVVDAGPPPGKRPPAPSGDPSPREIAYREFWKRLLEELHARYPALTRSRIPQLDSWFLTSAGRSGFGVGASFTRESSFRVELYIDTGTKVSTEQAFSALKEHEGEIHEQIGEPLVWDMLAERRASRVSLPRAGSIDDTSLHNELISWAAERMNQFKEVFRPLIADLEIV